MNSIKSILCLGDSYTIGEGVALHENFPYQLVQLLRNNHHQFFAPEIVAKTGWTTFELLEHLQHTQLQSSYNFVTLLIGVNNQYRGLSVADFEKDFETLLQKAIAYANDKQQNVIVLSIPDWGVTPFAADRDEQQIAKEIDSYNQACKNISLQYHTHFIEITNGTRLAKNDNSLLTTDNLHYSKKEYANWANLVYTIIAQS